jgi:aminoglycoside/choline kinase family phosphotransferase
VHKREVLITAFLSHHGWGEAQRGKLAGDASFRHYDRLVDHRRHAVLMDAPPPKEDVRPFVRIAEHLLDLGYSAPRILAADEGVGLLLLEDLGDDTFTRLLSVGEDEEDLYWLAVDMLIDLHGKGAPAIPEGLPAYDDDRLLTESLLLLDWYIPEMTGGPVPEDRREEYKQLWRDLFPTARRMPETLVLRDFHVDNLLRLKRDGIKACGLLDFQDAVAGPITYDLMSLLEDARRDIDPALVAGLKRRYLHAFPSLDIQAFDASWAVLAAQRHAKVIGIFTRLCRRDGKPAYLKHISRLWRLLDQSLEHPALEPLRLWLDRNIPAELRKVPKP